jgi:hypothetical protein
LIFIKATSTFVFLSASKNSSCKYSISQLLSSIILIISFLSSLYGFFKVSAFTKHNKIHQSKICRAFKKCFTHSEKGKFAIIKSNLYKLLKVKKS